MRRNRWILLCVVVAACTATTPAATNAPDATVVVTTTRPQTTTSAPPVDETDFASVADDITRSVLVLQPEFVTDLGAGDLVGVDVNYQLADLSLQGRSALRDAAATGLARLEGFDEATLTETERISADVLRYYLEDIVTMFEYADYENPVSFITGVHTGFPEFMADVHPVRSEQDAEDYVDRLIAFRAQLAELLAELERLGDLGMVPAERSLGIARWQIGALLGDGDAEQHPLVTDFKDRVAALDGENRTWAAGTGARAEAAVRNLFPMLEKLDDAVARVDGRSDGAPGVQHLPGGDEYYAAVLQHFLGIDMSPGQVHELGREHVARLRSELTVALAELGYDPEQNFIVAMQQAAADAGAMPTTSEPERAEVLARAQATVAKSGQAFESMFTAKPAVTLEVVRPRPGREGGSGAYYRSPPLDGSRAGIYYLSLGGTQFGLLTMDTTTYHEGIPGHHFQLALQRGMEHLPLHQRAFDFTGYAEGWALYAERLAYEAGLYEEDPFGNIGRLRMELLRAARMVVDTGLHWVGWSRDEAIAYMTGLGFGDERAAAEVDRYIVWPGQAPAYMVGMLEILRLREEAAAELGVDFDLAGFHDELLRHGSVPLALLEAVVENWTDSGQ